VFSEKESTMKNLTAETSVEIQAPRSAVWDALTRPELVKKYMMGADLHTDWRVGSPVRYTGVYQGKPFEEKGVVKRFVPNEVLEATHFSASSGKEDKPENYALVTWKLDGEGDTTKLTVSQDHIADEKGIEGSKKNWSNVLEGLKRTVEGIAS
jgi:uncharacterized protein YndB with AHSA1/START domain